MDESLLVLMALTSLTFLALLLMGQHVNEPRLAVEYQRSGRRRILVAMLGRCEFGKWKASHTYRNLEWAVLAPLRATGADVSLYFDMDARTSDEEKRAFQARFPEVQVQWLERKDQWERRRHAVGFAQQGGFDTVLLGRLDTLFLTPLSRWCNLGKQNIFRHCVLPEEHRALVIPWRCNDTMLWLPAQHFSAFLSISGREQLSQFNMELFFMKAGIAVRHLMRQRHDVGYVQDKWWRQVWGMPLGNFYILAGKTDDDLACLFR